MLTVDNMLFSRANLGSDGTIGEAYRSGKSVGAYREAQSYVPDFSFADFTAVH